MTSAANLPAEYTKKAVATILALINSRPRTPTADELAAAVQGLASGNDNELSWGPTPLGLEMMAMLPHHTEAAWFFDHIEDDDDPRREMVRSWLDLWFNRLRDAQLAATNIIDLAIAYRIERNSEFDAGLYHHDQLGAQLVRSLLALAGVPEAHCSEQAITEARKWMREPTKAEWREFLGRIRAGKVRARRAA